MTTHATEPGLDAPGWCHCRTGDCPFCSPPLTADELSAWDWQLAARSMAAVVRQMQRSPIPEHRKAADHVRAVLEFRATMHADRHITALLHMLDDVA